MYDVQSHFVKSFINLVGAIKTTGNSVDATPGQVGFVSAKTWAFIAQGAASVVTHPEIYLVQGSLYKEDGLGKHAVGRVSHGGYKESVKSRKINGNYISWFAKSSPKTEKPNVVQIGYNGSADCACPSFEKDKFYWLRVELKGSPVLRAYTRNLYRTIGVYTGCPTSDCSDVACAETADPKIVFEKFAEAIAKDPEVAQFLKEVKVVVAGTTSVTGVAYDIYTASRCDDGGIQALSEVAAVYGNDVTVSGRSGNNTTYKLVKKATDGAPANSVPLSLTWAKIDRVYKGQKKICLTLPLTSAGASNLSAVQTFYSGNTKFTGTISLYDEGTTSTTSSTTSTTSSTTTQAGDTYLGCTETLQATILSDNFIDIACEGVDAAVFSMPQSYNGYAWEECPCDVVTENTAQCVGLRLVAKTSSEVTDTFSDASFSQFDHVEYEPIKVLVSFVDQFGESCSFKSLPVTVIQNPVIRQGLGEKVARELIQSAMYEQNFFFEDNRMREVTAYPYLQAVDRKANYVTYYLAHGVPTQNGPSGQYGFDRFLYKIFVKEGVDASTFENWVTAYLATTSTGVTLQTL